MAIKIYYGTAAGQSSDNTWPEGACVLRPAPFVSINSEILKDGAGVAFGVNYNITLTGTLLATEGMPFGKSPVPIGAYADFLGGGSPGAANLFRFQSTGVLNNESQLIGPYKQWSNAFGISLDEISRPPGQYVKPGQLHSSILSKQNALRALFAVDGFKLEITDWGEDLPTIICRPRVVSISFDEGQYIGQSAYTINLEADTLLYGGTDDDSPVANEGTLGITSGVQPQSHNLSLGMTASGVTEAQLVTDFNKHFISEYSETWSIEEDDSLAASNDNPKGYRLSHSLAATGKTHYDGDTPPTPAWEQARNFVKSRLKDDISQYPQSPLGSGVLNLSGAGYNLSRNESIGESDGTYSVDENWLILTSGTAFETYQSSTSKATSEAFVNVDINGTIRGLTTISPSGYGPQSSGITAFDNALEKYYSVSNNGKFGIGSDIYKRANAIVAVPLNSQPLRITLATNEVTGEINYGASFNNRPGNIISGVITEQISVNDTYPGDTFAVIPVLGRKQGPILQYTGSRTEYTRDLSLNFQLDYTDIPYESGRNLVLKKPSVVEPTATQIAELITSVSPSKEPGVRKYFISPPTESWDPKTGVYSLTVRWTYELDK